jgi:hypothetical protein
LYELTEHEKWGGIASAAKHPDAAHWTSQDNSALMSFSEKGVLLTEVEPFLAQYRVFRRERSIMALATFAREFQRLTTEIAPLQARAVERAKEETLDFNVFRILRLAHKEVMTHTPFLANLLNPNGTHGQGDLFLRLFLTRLAARKVPVPLLKTEARWVVLTEQVTEFGNFDIHLRSHRLRCQIVIENKIGAVDQRDQLARYWKQMQRERSQFDCQQLVYLTPQPREPVWTLEPLPPFVNLTYRYDICVVLDSALQVIRSPRLRSSLQQYREIAQTC